MATEVISLSIAAELLRWRYRRTYDAALAGLLGALERREGRLFVSRSAVLKLRQAQAEEHAVEVPA